MNLIRLNSFFVDSAEGFKEITSSSENSEAHKSWRATIARVEGLTMKEENEK